MNLKEIRTKRGLSQRALAKVLGNSQPNIVVMEREGLPPGTELLTIQRINQALKCRAIITGEKIEFVEK